VECSIRYCATNEEGGIDIPIVDNESIVHGTAIDRRRLRGWWYWDQITDLIVNITLSACELLRYIIHTIGLARCSNGNGETQDSLALSRSNVRTYIFRWLQQTGATKATSVLHIRPDLIAFIICQKHRVPVLKEICSFMTQYGSPIG
jgi:hypothetical protein